MEIHLVDGTYELFRYFYAMPPARDEAGREVAAVRGVVSSVLGMINGGGAPPGGPPPHLIETFPKNPPPGYKTREGGETHPYTHSPLLSEGTGPAGPSSW